MYLPTGEDDRYGSDENEILKYDSILFLILLPLIISLLLLFLLQLQFFSLL